MDASQSVGLDQQLEVVGDLVSRVETAVRARLVRNLKQTIDLLLIEADTTGKLREPGVSLIASLVDDIDVEVFLLLVKEGLAEFPEFVGLCLEHGNTGFVNERRGWVPWLNLVPENKLNLVCVLRFDQRDHGVVDRCEHLLGELIRRE